MNKQYLYAALGCLALWSNGLLAITHQQINELTAQATLVFSDDFNRVETDNREEQLGNGWQTNSAQRAKGQKQADLIDGVLNLKRAKGIRYSVIAKHKAPIRNGIVQAKFNLKHKRGARFNFYDANAKAQSGHVCQVKIEANKITLTDQIHGKFRPGWKKLEKSEQQTLLKETIKQVNHKFNLNQWYDLTILIQNNVMTVLIDNQQLAQLTSKGIAHPNKQDFAFSISNEVELDDLNIWQL